MLIFLILFVLRFSFYVVFSSRWWMIKNIKSRNISWQQSVLMINQSLLINTAWICVDINVVNKSYYKQPVNKLVNCIIMNYSLKKNHQLFDFFVRCRLLFCQQTPEVLPECKELNLAAFVQKKLVSFCGKPGRESKLSLVWRHECNLPLILRAKWPVLGNVTWQPLLLVWFGVYFLYLFVRSLIVLKDKSRKFNLVTIISEKNTIH